MHSFIALAKKSNFQTANPGTLSADDKQGSQQDSSKLSPKLTETLTKIIAEALTRLGFKQVAAETPMDEQASNFMPLNYLGAYVVNSSDKEKIKEAQKSIDELDSDTYETSLSRISIALDWMLSQFRSERNRGKTAIVNMSLGFAPEHIFKNDRATLMIGIQELISTLVDDFDVLPVVAIGNDGPGKMRAPGYFPETLSVGAVDFNREPAGFSGGGLSPIGERTQPDIAGYGVNIFSSLERDKNSRSLYKHMSGTSMATPYVAGIAALYASADAKLYGEALRQHLLNTALPLQAPADRVGAGLARFTENGNKNP